MGLFGLLGLADAADKSTKGRKPIRKSLKERIREEQGFKCNKRHCSLKRGGQVHHKNGDNKDNRRSNMELLCTSCHKAITSEQASKRGKASWF
jgi:hypothetical protein